MKSALISLLLAGSCLSLYADAGREEPVGLVLLPGGGKVLRANTETPLAARAGDILFSGDSLKVDGAPASFLYCPQKTSDTIDAGSDVVLESKQLKFKAGKLGTSKPVNACFLPTVVRVAVASQQHYGVSMTRGLAKPDEAALAFNALPADVQALAQPFEDALKANPNDTQSLLEEAALFDRNNLQANAVAAYRKASNQWPDAVWIKGRIFELEESLATQAAIKAAAISPDAKTYAMVVGIGKYQKLDPKYWLQYPNGDATAFGKYLADPNGGRIPPDQMLVLKDEQATTAALRNAFQTFLKNRPGKKDTVFIMIAAHGTVDTRGSYIVTYDSDPQDLSTTALPMAEIQQLVEDELSKVGRVVLLVDLCHADRIDNTSPLTIGSAVEKLGTAPGEMMGIMASRPKEIDGEGAGGHGAFAMSLLKGMEGAADQDRNHSVTAGELDDFVRTDVPAETGRKQHPRDFGNLENGTKLFDVPPQGINITRYKSLFDSRSGEPLLLAQAAGPPPISAEAQRDIDAFQAIVTAKQHLLPTDPAGPWPLLTKLRAELTPELTFLQENSLRVALEDKAQQVLLRYLEGDQNPPPQGLFDDGSRYMEAAITLTPESLYLQGRDSFFMGRSLLFRKQFSQATDLLERAVRIDPKEAYGYNALGIAYLEQADFAKSIPAFRDAARLAPNWSYPLHNLALAYIEAGQPEGAIRAYQQAMKITPKFAYLPYNLGLIYQRLNRRREAEDEYRSAMNLAPDSAEPLNALGTLKAAEGKKSEAQDFYRKALTKKTGNLLPVRHNLAVLLSQSKDSQAEAIDLYKQNLAEQKDYLPSRLALAQLLADRNDAAGSVEQYREVIALAPEYVGARVELARQLSKANQPEAALEQLRTAVKSEDRNAALWEQIGDLERTMNHAAEAREAYATALKLETENSGRKRLRTKMTF